MRVGEVAGERLTVLVVAVIADHGGPVALGGGPLGGRGIVGHQHGGVGADQRGGQGHGLGVVARGPGAHTAGPLGGGQGGDFGVGAAELEGAGALQIFRLEHDLRPGHRVHGGGGDHRGVVGHTGDLPRRGPHTIQGQSFAGHRRFHHLWPCHASSPGIRVASSARVRRIWARIAASAPSGSARRMACNTWCSSS